MQIANVYLEQGKRDEAFDVLQALIDNKSTLPQMRNIAALKLASYKLDTNAPAAEISALLQPLLANDNNSDIATELMAMLFIREHNISQAKTEYEKIAASASASDALKARAQDMINLLSEQN